MSRPHKHICPRCGADAHVIGQRAGYDRAKCENSFCGHVWPAYTRGPAKPERWRRTTQSGSGQVAAHHEAREFRELHRDPFEKMKLAMLTRR